MSRARRRPGLAAAWMLAAVTPWQPASAADPAGAWSGNYTCYQGFTALHLALVHDAKGNLRGRFHFGATAANPSVPEGCYTMKGSFDAASGTVRLTPGSWLLRPQGYVMIGLQGRIDPAGTLFAGENSPQVPGCTVFSLHAVSPDPALPAACQSGAVTASR